MGQFKNFITKLEEDLKSGKYETYIQVEAHVYSRLEKKVIKYIIHRGFNYDIEIQQDFDDYQEKRYVVINLLGG